MVQADRTDDLLDLGVDDDEDDDESSPQQAQQAQQASGSNVSGAPPPLPLSLLPCHARSSANEDSSRRHVAAYQVPFSAPLLRTHTTVTNRQTSI